MCLSNGYHHHDINNGSLSSNQRWMITMHHIPYHISYIIAMVMVMIMVGNGDCGSIGCSVRSNIWLYWFVRWCHFIPWQCLFLLLLFICRIIIIVIIGVVVDVITISSDISFVMVTNERLRSFNNARTTGHAPRVIIITRHHG